MEFFNTVNAVTFGISQSDADKLGADVCGDLTPAWTGGTPGLAYMQERDGLQALHFSLQQSDLLIQDGVVGYCAAQYPKLVSALAHIGTAVKTTGLGVEERDVATTS